MEMNGTMKEKILSADLSDGQTAIFYAGQMGFFIKRRGVCIMIDGYLSDYVDRNCNTPLVTWKRRYDPPVLPSELDFVDIALCTHAHYDHTDPYTLRGLAAANPEAKIIAPPPAADVAVREAGIPRERIITARPGETISPAPGVTITAFPAAHEKIHMKDDGSCDEVGYRVCFDGFTVVHTGDCCPYDGLSGYVKGCDVLTAPINGRDEYRTKALDIIGCFTGSEALKLSRDSGAGELIPGHYDLYDVNMTDADAFLKIAREDFPDVKVRMLSAGEGAAYCAANSVTE